MCLILVWLPLGLRQVGKSLLLHKCARDSVAVDENGRDELGKGRTSLFVAVEQPVRFREGWMLCTLDALGVGANLPRVDGTM